MPNDEDGAVAYQLVCGGDRLIRVAKVGARLGSPGRLLAEADGRLRPCAEQLRYLVRDEHGRLVDSAARARAQVALELEFHDGRVQTLRSSRGPGRPQPTGGEQKRLL